MLLLNSKIRMMPKTPSMKCMVDVLTVIPSVFRLDFNTLEKDNM